MKRRTGLLFSSAAVLGLIGGAAGGFLIQRARPATPLPPFQRTLAVAAAPGVPDPHDAATDDEAKLDGDLRAVLLAKPAGAKDAADYTSPDWMTLGDLAEYYEKPGDIFAQLNSLAFRRAARTGWTTADGTGVEIDLVQFRSTDDATSYYVMTHFPHDTAVAGTATGYVGRYLSKDASGEFSAYGLVQHGDVVEQVFVSRTTGAPTTDEVMKVTKDQADLL